MARKFALILMTLFFINKGYPCEPISLSKQTAESLKNGFVTDIQIPVKNKSLAKSASDSSRTYSYLPGKYTTEHFKIHYTTTGTYAVDDEITNTEGVPDYVYETGIAAEYSYNLIVNELGFEPPPWDYGIDGDEIDIYIISFNLYGETTAEYRVDGNDRQESWTSYMKIDNNYSYGYNTYGLDAMRVTVAHELFHMVQIGYNWFIDDGPVGTYWGDTYFLEWSSVWMEEVAYPEVNDYYAYLDAFFLNPNQSIWDEDYSYALGPFLKFLVEKYGNRSIVSKVWEKIGKNIHAFEALESVVQSELGSEVYELWNEFQYRCYFTDSRYNTSLSLSEDAKDFPELYFSPNNPDRLYDLSDTLSIPPPLTTLLVKPYACHAVKVNIEKNMFVGILPSTMENPENFAGRWLSENSSHPHKSEIFNLKNGDYIDYFSSGDELIIFTTNIDQDSKVQLEYQVGERVEPDVASEINTIYPNPVNGAGVSIKFILDSRNDNYYIKLYNLLGQEVYETLITNQYAGLLTHENFVRIQIPSNLASGLYFLSVETPESMAVKKITILK